MSLDFWDGFGMSTSTCKLSREVLCFVGSVSRQSAVCQMTFEMYRVSFVPNQKSLVQVL